MDKNYWVLFISHWVFKINKRYITLLKLGISLLLLTYLFHKVDAIELMYTIKNVSLFFLILAFSLKLLGIAISSKSWQILLQPLGSRSSFTQLFSLYLMSYFFNNFTPGNIGGDLVRIYEFPDERKKTIVPIISVVLERGIGLFVLLAITSVASVISTNLVDVNIRLLVWGMVIFYLLGLYLVFVQKNFIRQFSFLQKVVKSIATILGIGRIIEEIRNNLQIYKNSPIVILKALLTSITFWIITVISVWVIAVALSFNIPFYYYFIAVPLISILVMLPISIHGLGVREVAYVYFFTQVGVSTEAALSLALIRLGFMFTVSMIGGIMYGIRSGSRVFRKE